MALGVPPEVWETTTPRELIAVMQRMADLKEAERKRADHRAGVMCSVMASAWLKKKGGGQWEPEDFFRERKELSTDQLRQKMLGIADQLNRNGT